MKTIIKSILSLTCLAGIVLAGGENQDGSCDLAWTLSWLAVSVLAGALLKRIFYNPIKNTRNGNA